MKEKELSHKSFGAHSNPLSERVPLLRRSPGALLLILWGAVLLSSCAFFSSGLSLEVSMPDEPPPWSCAGVEIDWSVRYPSPRGGVETAYLSAGDRRIDIRVDRGLDIPVVAYPLGRLKPAGGWVDGDTEEVNLFSGKRALRLSWKNGAAAELLLELWDEPEKRERLDAGRLSGEMYREGEGNPWTCDRERIRSAVLFASLSSIQISREEVFEIEYELPAGDWLYENPLFEGDVSAVLLEGLSGGGTAETECYAVRFSGLSPGIHRFYSEESRKELHILVNTNGESRFICDSPGIF